MNVLLSYNADLLPKVRMIGQIHYKQPWIHFARRINEYILYVIRDGNMYLKEDDLCYHLRPGDFFVLEPGLQHEGYQRACCDYYYIHFTHPQIVRVTNDDIAMAELAEKRRKSLISYNLDAQDPTDPITYIPKQFHLPGGEFRTTLHAAVECYNQREEHYKRVVSTLIHGFLLQVAHQHLVTGGAIQGKTRKRAESVAEQVVQYLNQNYSKHLTSQDISEQCEMNFDYLNRTFAKMTGSTIFSYINTLRIYHAKDLIATTDLPFSEIGYLVGIEDRYYFSKLFRKMTGKSPTEYYKEVRSQ